MLEFSLTSQIIIAVGLLCLCLVAYFFHKQRKEIAAKEDQLRQEKFANKQTRIVREIAARLPMQQTEEALVIPLAQTSVLTNQQTRSLAQNNASAKGHQRVRPQSIQENTENHERKSANTSETKHSAPNDQKAATQLSETIPRSAPPEMPGHNVLYEPQEIQEAAPPEHPNKKPMPKRIPRPVKTAKGSIITYQNVADKGHQTRGEGQKSDFHLNLDESLYDQIKKYSKWLADQSDDFTLEVHSDQSIEIIPMLISKEDLARLNGHWFGVFEPPDLDMITKEARAMNANLVCGFNNDAVEELCAPARQILMRGQKANSERYDQVLKESELAEFINFLDDLKSIIVTNAAE